MRSNVVRWLMLTGLSLSALVSANLARAEEPECAPPERAIVPKPSGWVLGGSMGAGRVVHIGHEDLAYGNGVASQAGLRVGYEIGRFVFDIGFDYQRLWLNYAVLQTMPVSSVKGEVERMGLFESFALYPEVQVVAARVAAGKLRIDFVGAAGAGIGVFYEPYGVGLYSYYRVHESISDARRFFRWHAAPGARVWLTPGLAPFILTGVEGRHGYPYHNPWNDSASTTLSWITQLGVMGVL
jgi:hypothetical protein